MQNQSQNIFPYLNVCDETVRRVLIKAGYTYKRKTIHAKEQERLRCPNQKATLTILSSIQVNGKMCYTTYTGDTTAQRFHDYLEKKLIPSLDKNAVVIMDNMRSHRAKIVREILDSKGVNYIYLPPYSPDLNPIEKLWSKVKAILRKMKIRLADQLPNAVKQALQAVCPEDCIGWFVSCGICAN